MIRTWRLQLFGVMLAVSTAVVCAQELFIYPTKGQNAEQQKKDEYECYNWAKNNTGFDPMAPPVASAPPPSGTQQSGGAVRGAVGGAALGAIIGDSSKSAGRGAAAGALVGGVRQSRKNQQVQQDQAQWEQQQAAEYSSKRNSYNRAYSACLEGRGYTVK